MAFSAIQWFALPANLDTLLHRPWTSITLCLPRVVPEPFSVLIAIMVGSMLWLWAFGLYPAGLIG